MIIWFAVLIPLVGAAALYWIFHHKVLIWEAGAMVAAPIIFIACAKGCSEWVQTRDTEYWGGYVTSAEYYEDWNERVSCRHPRPCSHRDKDGNTKHMNDGYYHSYDVDYHPEYWQLNTSVGETFSTTKSRFDQFVTQFGNKKFVDLHRNYHTDDGDKYVATFMGEAEKLEPVTVERSYENRVQASQSVFNFKEIDPKIYGLFDYPKISGLTQPCVLGPGATFPAEKKLQYLNATLGAPHQVRLFILVFQNQPIQAATEQEAYWKRGNKNELVTCVGVDKDMAIQWAHVFSWTEVDEIKVEARNEIMGMKTLDLMKYIDWLGPAVQSKWVRKKFADFSYLTVEPSTTAVVWSFIGTLVITIGIGIWAVMNDADPARGGVSLFSSDVRRTGLGSRNRGASSLFDNL